MSRTVKVAVIGTGLAGLTTAYLLSTQPREDDVEFEIHLFEKTSTLGMDSSSISLPVPGKEQEWRVDVPMRSFQGGYYPQLIALYKQLGVGFRKTDFSYSFSRLSPSTGHITARMIYNGYSGLAGVSMPSEMSNLHLQFKVAGIATCAVMTAWTYGMFILLALQLLFCYLRLLFLSAPLFRGSIQAVTFRDWVTETVPNNFIARWTMLDVAWTDFTQSVLIPLFSAVCTAPESAILEHPVEEFLDYIWLTLGAHHYVAVNGVRDVVSRLIGAVPVRNIHLASPISTLQTDPHDPNLISLQCGARMFSGFSHVVFATQAPRAVPLLASYLASLPLELKSRRRFVEEQIHCLEKFAYTSTIVINHTDDTLLPDNIQDRRDLNLINVDPFATTGLPGPSRAEDDMPSPQLSVPPSYTMATHRLPRPAGFPKHLPVVFQTTNPIIEPREGRILSVSRLERAILTLESKEAIKNLHLEERRQWWWRNAGKSRLGPLQGSAAANAPGIWICGSFAYKGIPLLEGCVVSARTIVEQGIMKREGMVVRRPPW